MEGCYKGFAKGLKKVHFHLIAKCVRSSHEYSLRMMSDQWFLLGLHRFYVC